MRASILNRTYDSIQACTLVRTVAWTNDYMNEHLTLAGIYALLHSYYIILCRYYKKRLKINRYTPCRPDFTNRVSTNGTNWMGGLVAHRATLDAEAGIKNLCCYRGPNLDRPIVQPVVSLYTAWIARHNYAREIFHATTLEASMKSHTLEYKTLQSGMQAATLEVTLIFTHATSLHHHFKHTSSYAEQTHECAHGLHNVC
jgi:hypothetical protein